MLTRPLKFKRGDKGPFIVDIQRMFAKLGFDPGEPEGVFVSATEDAVRVFQSEYGLPVNGIMDAKALKLLYEEADPGGYPKALIEGWDTPLEDDDVQAKTEEEEEEEGTEGQDAPPGEESDPDGPMQQREYPMKTTGMEESDHTIVISLSQRALGLYEGDRLLNRYPVAIGKPSTPTPAGTHKVLEKVPHPGGGLGTRWIGFTYQMHGIHGTNRPDLIGSEVSNGCVRMHNANVEEVYEKISVGTPVVVIAAPLESWLRPADYESQPKPEPKQPKEHVGLLDPAAPQPKDSKSTNTYIVKSGDSLWAIAKQFGITTDAIIIANKIKDPNLIFPGEILEIPQ